MEATIMGSIGVYRVLQGFAGGLLMFRMCYSCTRSPIVYYPLSHSYQAPQEIQLFTSMGLHFAFQPPPC